MNRQPRTAGAEDDTGWNPLLLKPRRWRRALSLSPFILRTLALSAVTLTIVFLALQFLIPARLVISGMGAVGRPSVAMGILFAFLWCLSALRPGGLPAGRQPIRWLIGIHFAVQLIGYAIGMYRIPVVVEANAGDRWIIFMTAMSGVALLIADGLQTRAQLDRILRVTVALTTVMAVVGILQYLRIIDLTRYVRIPGLSANSALLGTGSRGDLALARVAGTANHYIEFGVVLGLALPIALHFALFASKQGRSQALAWLQVALIAAAIPMSISRAAIITTAITLALLFSVWKWRLRYGFLVVAGASTVVFYILTRGLVGTILSLFTHAESDPSIQNRLSDQSTVFALWHQSPVFGRGAGMIIPERYILLDNQFFVTLIAGGIVGVLALTSLFVVPYVMARSIRLRAPREEDRHLGQALAATFPAAYIASFTFDSFSFATFTGLLFVLIGVVGALWRLHDPNPVRTLEWSPSDSFVAPPILAPDHPRWRSRFVIGTREDVRVDDHPVPQHACSTGQTGAATERGL